jgi:predicted dehydrogenase
VAPADNGTMPPTHTFPDAADQHTPPMRWGLVGPGGIAHRFADALTVVPGTQLVAVFGRAPTRAQAFAQRWGARAEATLPALLGAPDIDAVYVATPHSAHADVVRAALLAGKHVVCEKPLTPNLAQAEPLVALAHERGLLLMEALWTRFLPAVQQARAWLVAGEIGRLQALQSSFRVQAPQDPAARHLSPDLAGGTLLDIGVYNLSLSQWFCAAVGEHAVPAFDVHAHLGATGVDERLAMQLVYPSGVVSQCLTAFDGQGDNQFVLHGQRGTIRLHAAFWHPTAVTLERWGEAPQTLALPLRHNGFEYEIEAAVAAIRAAAVEVAEISHAHTLATLGLMDAVRARIGVRYPFE